jgi:DNA-binding XRE family transcriptional regulator
MMVKQPLKDGVEIGRRIRRQRINKGMRQTELATSCGITFQQIQKYEKGMNRVGGSRMIKRGTKSNPIEGEHQLFGFLTTDANAEVGAIHPKAMPVILTTETEIEQWMTTPAEEALRLQRPLPDGSLKIVATGEKEDAAGHSSTA